MNTEKIFKEREDASPIKLSQKMIGPGEFEFLMAIGPRKTIVDKDRVVYGDFELNKGKYYIAYVVFCGEQNILKLASVPEKGGQVEHLEAYVGSFYEPRIVFHNGEQLIFAHIYTDKSKLVCIRRGQMYDVSGGGSNHLSGLVDMGDCLVAAIDMDHYLKQEEKINGGVMPFDGFGIQIMRKPGILVYHLNNGEGGGLLKADADAFIAGGSQLVRLARKGKKFYGAYLRFEKSTYVAYVTDFGEAWRVADTYRMVRELNYKIKGGQHILEIAGETYTMPVEGGVEINLAPGKPCSSMRVNKNVRDLQQVPPTGFGYYWGDLRVHSNESLDSHNTGWHCGPAQDKYINLKHLRQLDFCAISDYDSHLTDEAWADLRLNNELYNIPDRFATLNAYEWSQGFGVKDKAGHYNVIFRSRGDLLRASHNDSDAPQKLATGLTNPMREGMMIAANPSELSSSIDWIKAPDTVLLTEIFNAKGNFENMDCPHHPFEYNRKVNPRSTVQEGLKNLPLGFVGGGGHEGLGITCVIADNLSREAIYDGLAQRRCYATTGARIILEYSINGYPMGSVVPPNRLLQVQVIVEGTSEITEALLITDIGVIPLPSKNNKIDTKLNLDPCMYAYVRIMQRDGECAWSSPIFCG